jgi:DNA-directed RNA polymerase sigma subunit (sigma70/sigma32)
MVDSSIDTTSFGRTISYRSFALNKIGSINKINKMYALLEQSNERPPSAEEIAKELDMTVNDVKRHEKLWSSLVNGYLL